jgi:pyridoxal/pyridoxine/pyridoxamine kinase
VESFQVQQVDTTGAGDAFVGAMLSKLVQDLSALQVGISTEFIFVIIKHLSHNFRNLGQLPLHY